MTDREHIEMLARELNVTIRYDVEVSFGQDGPRADLATNTLHLQPWHATTNPYWVALHELGHIATTTEAQGWIANVERGWYLIDVEAQAWAWALENARRPLTSTARSEIAFSLSSYLETEGLWENDSLAKVAKAVGAVDTSLRRLPDELPYVERAQRVWDAVVRRYGTTA